MNKIEKRMCLMFILMLAGIGGVIWSAFAGISGEQGAIVYGRELWFLLPSTLTVFFSIYYAGYLSQGEQ